MTGIALQFKQIVEGVVGGAESVRFCGFAKGKTAAEGANPLDSQSLCDRSGRISDSARPPPNQRFEARHPAGELAPSSTSVSKSLF